MLFILNEMIYGHLEKALYIFGILSVVYYYQQISYIIQMKASKL